MIGIKKVSILFFLKFNILHINKEDRKNYGIYSISVLLGVLLFCIFSNLILLIPSINFYISNSIENVRYYIKSIISILKLTVILFSLIGLNDLLNFRKIFKNRENKLSYYYDKNFFISLFISTLIYLIFAPKSIYAGIHYDTGLYHLPLVNHLSKFAIEPGLANLHFRYGFYGISFFGQVALQIFSKNTNFLSPSLNIGFLAIYISYFLPYIKKLRINSFKNLISNKIIFTEKINSISILYFSLSIIFFTGGIFKTLSSYSLDLPLFICGSIGFHLLLLSFFENNNYKNFIAIFWLSFFSPIIKLTGITIPFFFLLYLFLHFMSSLFIEYKIYDSPNKIKPIKNTFKKFFVFIYNLRLFVNYKLSITLVIAIASVYILTNLIITGYPLFPTDFLGPLHNYSINPEILENIRSGTLDWHRFQNSINNNNYWVISYLKTRNGLINIVFWFIPSIISIIITIIFRIFYSSKNFTFNVNYLLFSLTTTILFCFFTLIPLVNYFPWFPHCIIFLMLTLLNRIINIKNLKINFYKITFSMLTLFLIINSAFSYSNSLIIKNIPSSIFKSPILKIPNYETVEIVPKKWVSFTDPQLSKNIQISFPKKGDQCWGIEPPCTISKNFLKKSMSKN